MCVHTRSPLYVGICVCIRVIHMLFLEDSGLLQLGRHESKPDLCSSPQRTCRYGSDFLTAMNQADAFLIIST